MVVTFITLLGEKEMNEPKEPKQVTGRFVNSMEVE